MMLSLIFYKCIELASFPCLDFISSKPAKELLKQIKEHLIKKIDEQLENWWNPKIDLDLDELVRMIAVLEINIYNFPSLWFRDIQAYLETSRAGRIYYAVHAMFLPPWWVLEFQGQVNLDTQEQDYPSNLKEVPASTRKFTFSIDPYSMTPHLRIPKIYEAVSQEELESINNHQFEQEKRAHISKRG